MKKTKILLVCTANICRSPMAQGMLERLLESEGLGRHFQVDSAGTHVAQVGSRPDKRAQQVALGYGIDLSGIRARNLRKKDYLFYDYIVAMDMQNLHLLEKLRPARSTANLMLMMDFAPEPEQREVPDPYYGNLAGFERVFQMLDMATKGMLGQIMPDLA